MSAVPWTARTQDLPADLAHGRREADAAGRLLCLYPDGQMDVVVDVVVVVAAAAAAVAAVAFADGGAAKDGYYGRPADAVPYRHHHWCLLDP